jgi:15-cis-phytoene synthase
MAVLRPPDVTLALAYATAQDRRKLAVLLDFDLELGRVVAAAREPVIGQIRLAWWRDQLLATDGENRPALPLLQRVVEILMVNDVNREGLVKLVDGWESLLARPELSDVTLSHYADLRGGALFGLAARLCRASTSDGILTAGAGWALMDFAVHCSQAEVATRAVGLARERFERSSVAKLPRTMRILAVLARDDARRGLEKRHPPGSPRRIIRILTYLLLRR